MTDTVSQTETLASPMGRPLLRREVVILLSVIAVAKVAILGVEYFVPPLQATSLPLYFPDEGGLGGALALLTNLWDSAIYQQIAMAGYPAFLGSKLYAFSPIYPALIRSLEALAGSYWASALIVTNAFGFAYPIVLLRTFGLRAAILAGLFPTYLVYSTVGYSDAIALTLLALCMFFFLRGRKLTAGVALALAALVLYDLFVAALAFLLYMWWFQRDRSRGAYVRFIAPVALAGASVLAAYQLFTGSAFTFFTLERELWSVAVTSPIGQIEWLVSGSGPGFLSAEWQVLGVSFTPTFWVVRNLLFEAFFFVGILLLARLSDPNKWLFAVYSAVMTVPLLFVQGTPAYSIPRLMLAAFPVFLGYSQKVFTRKWSVVVYAVVCVMVSAFVMLAYVYAFFA